MTGPAPAVDFSHEAFLYSGLAEFLDGTCGFVREGLDRDEAVLVATGGERLAALRAFFHAERGVVLVDMAEVGANPARIIPVWREFLAKHEGRTVRGIGEPVWSGRSEAELAECHQHEALLNVAFADGPEWRLMCPYDTAGLPSKVIAEARANHPFVFDGDAWSASDTYHPERASEALRDHPLPPPPAGAVELDFVSGQLGPVRRLVQRHATKAGVSPDAVEDLVLCVDEIATNSLLHGGGSGLLRIWTDAAALVCEVSDRGVIDDPLVGRVPPPPDRLGGRGVWLANQLCDLVQLRSGPGGTVVRLHTRLAAGRARAASGR